MKKDVIYIDTEDDITSIIEKIKAAEAKVVAIVPPKRIGVLQSIVNLKLLQRAATGSDHRVVLITNDNALTALASGIGLPIAKNLQSKPEIAQLTALEVDDEDVINGEDLPVGELAATATPTPRPGNSSKKDDALNAAAAASAADLDTAATATEPTSAAAKVSKGKSGAPKIPNFESFRKRLFLIGGAGVVLVIFLIWAIFIAPHATVTIAAKTRNVALAPVVTLDPAAQASNPTGNILKPLTQQVKKTNSADFTTTGTKAIGTKATGQLKLTNQTLNAITVPAGTQFVAAGKQFTSDTSVALAAPQVCGGFQVCKDSKNVNITAVDIGEDYNIGPQDYSSSAPVTATATQATSGGSKQTVQVVAQADVDKAKAQLAQTDASAIKADLRKQFSGDVIVIDESFSAVPGNPNVTPNIGDQATQGKLSVETTYTLLAVSRSDVKQLLDNQLQAALKEQKNQRIYADGDQSLVFKDFQPGNNTTYAVKMTTTGSLGPDIDTTKLAKDIQGKRFGEVQQIVNNYDGVDNVDVSFSPFWVTTVPTPDKTDIKFKVTNG